MTQNLRLAAGTTLTPSDSNVANNWYFPSNDLTEGDTYSEARSHNGDSETGNWYNFCAASAGTVCDEMSTTNSRYDVCPKGWRMPNASEFNTIIDHAIDFAPIATGRYGGGRLRYTEYGYWWSSSAFGSGLQYFLHDKDNSLSTSDTPRNLGMSIRCIRSN